MAKDRRMMKKKRKVNLRGVQNKGAKKFARKGGVAKKIELEKTAKLKRERRRKQEEKQRERSSKRTKERAQASAEEEAALVTSHDPRAEGFEALEGMSVEDFLSGDILSNGRGEGKKKKKKKKKKLNATALDDDDDEGEDESEDDEESDESDSDESVEQSMEEHRKNLLDLQKTDPEFFAYLQKEDERLLNFGGGGGGETATGGDAAEKDEENEEGRVGVKANDADDNESNGNDDDDSENDGEGEEGEEEGEEGDDGDTKLLTTAVLRRLEHSAIEKKSLTALARLCQAFSAGVAMELDDGNERGGGIQKRAYRVRSTHVLEDLVVTCVSTVWKALAYHLGKEDRKKKKKKKKKKANKSEEEENDEDDDEEEDEDDEEEESSNGNRAHNQPWLPSSHPRWQRLRPMVKSFLGNLLLFLQQLSEKEENATSLILQQCRHYVPFFVSVPRLLRKVNKTMLELWSGSTSDTIRILAYARIRQLALTAPFPFIETSLRTLYLTFVRNARLMNEISRPAIASMRRCVVEHFGLDLRSGYQFAFVYIRELAIYLRNAMIEGGGREALRAVSNWQYLNCLRVWTDVLVAYPDPNQLRALVYPLIQILLGTMTVLRTARLRFLPMRFHCAALVIRIMLATDIYVPLAPPLLRCLATFAGATGLALNVGAGEAGGRGKKGRRGGGGGRKGGKKRRRRGRPRVEEFSGTVTPLDLLVRISKQQALSRTFQDAAFSRTLRLLEDYFTTQRCTVAFPELAFPVTEALSSFEKACDVLRWRQQAKAVRSRLNQHAAIVRSQRASLAFSPHDTHAVNNFMAVDRAKERSEMVARLVQEEREKEREREEHQEALARAKRTADKLAKAQRKKERKQEAARKRKRKEEEEEEEEEEGEESESEEETTGSDDEVKGGSRKTTEGKGKKSSRDRTEGVSDVQRMAWSSKLSTKENDAVDELELSDRDSDDDE